jgi:hypothetical protein
MAEQNVIKLKKREYDEPQRVLLSEVKDIAAAAVRAVCLNGSGGFPARQPDKGEAVIKT